MPSVYSWQQSVPSEQLSVFSDMVIHRNRHYGTGNTTREQSVSGIEQMTAGVEAWYPIPNMTDPVANFRCVLCSHETRKVICVDFIQFLVLDNPSLPSGLLHLGTCILPPRCRSAKSQHGFIVLAA